MAEADVLEIESRARPVEKPREPARNKWWERRLTRRQSFVPIAAFLATVAAACKSPEILVGETTTSPTPETSPSPPSHPEIAPTPIPSPEITRTPIEPTPAPTPAETVAPTPEAFYKITVDPQLEAALAPEKLAQNKEAVEQVVNLFPKIGNLDIVLKLGTQSRFSKETQQIEIAFDQYLTVELVKWATAHELWHYYDPVNNARALGAYIPERKLVELESLREVALADSFWGRDYPDLERIFTEEKLKVSKDSLKTYSREELAALSSKSGDGVWIACTKNEKPLGITPFANVFYKEFQAINNWAKEAKGEAGFRSIGQFLSDSRVFEKLQSLADANPLFAKALELLAQKDDLLRFPNIIWPSELPTPSDLEGQYLSDWWRALPKYIHLVGSEAVAEGNEDFISGLSSSQLSTVKSSMEDVRTLADGEKTADLGAVAILTQEKTSLSPLLEELRAISR